VVLLVLERAMPGARAPQRLSVAAIVDLDLDLVAAAWVGLVLGVVAAVMALLSAELSSRDEAVVDALTGLYNPTALVCRFAQTAEQARVLDGWLSVIMCDLDHCCHDRRRGQR